MAALELAADLLCKSGKSSLDETKLRELCKRGEHPDLHVVALEEEKKDISIEQVRDLISALHLVPYYGARRVAIIDDAHELSISAQNALLLTLEEAPSGSHLILVTHLPHRLLPTILSRSQEVTFGSLSEKDLEEIFKTFNENPGEQLIASLDGSFERLDLSQFRSNPALPITPSKKLSTHIAEYQERTRTLSKLVEKVLNSKNAGDALSVAAELSDKSFEVEEVYRALFESLRRQLRGAPKDSAAHYAELLLKTVNTHKLVSERNLNPSLQLGELLLQFKL